MLKGIASFAETKTFGIMTGYFLMNDDFELSYPQLWYLQFMYLHKLFPGEEPMSSGKIIRELVRFDARFFADYTIGDLVEDFYTLAQPWMIDIPLIECQGNIGNPEDMEYMWSEAASPCYTEAVLTEAGMKYVEENNVMKLNFHNPFPFNPSTQSTQG